MNPPSYALYQESMMESWDMEDSAFPLFLMSKLLLFNSTLLSTESMMTNRCHVMCFETRTLKWTWEPGIYLFINRLDSSRWIHDALMRWARASSSIIVQSIAVVPSLASSVISVRSFCQGSCELDTSCLAAKAIFLSLDFQIPIQQWLLWVWQHSWRNN